MERYGDVPVDNISIMGTVLGVIGGTIPMFIGTDRIPGIRPIIVVPKVCDGGRGNAYGSTNNNIIRTDITKESDVRMV